MSILMMAGIVGMGVLLGALLGSTRSCTDGGCPLTANPKRGALYGGFLGLMVALILAPSSLSGGVSDEALAASGEPLFTTAASVALLEEEAPTAVYFTADWCGACRKLKPVLNKVAQDLAPGVRFVKVDVDDQPALAQRYAIQFLPTVVVLRGGEEQGRLTGAASYEALRKLLAVAESNVKS